MKKKIKSISIKEKILLGLANRPQIAPAFKTLLDDCKKVVDKYSLTSKNLNSLITYTKGNITNIEDIVKLGIAQSLSNNHDVMFCIEHGVIEDLLQHKFYLYRPYYLMSVIDFLSKAPILIFDEDSEIEAVQYFYLIKEEKENIGRNYINNIFLQTNNKVYMSLVVNILFKNKKVIRKIIPIDDISSIGNFIKTYNEIEISEDNIVQIAIIALMYVMSILVDGKHASAFICKADKEYGLNDVSIIERDNKTFIQIKRLAEDTVLPYYDNPYHFVAYGNIWDLGLTSQSNVDKFTEVFDALRENEEYNDDILSLENIYINLNTNRYILENPICIDYDDKTIDYLSNKYKNKLSETLEDLYEFAPYKVYTIRNANTEDYMTCTLLYISNQNKMILLVSQYSEMTCRNISTHIQIDDTVNEDINSAIKDINTIMNNAEDLNLFKGLLSKAKNKAIANLKAAVLIFIHLCSNNRNKSQKELEEVKDINRVNNVTKPEKSNVEEKEISDKIIIHQSKPISVFNLTKRSIVRKKISKEHARGWHLPQHVRSGHYRRVWVGHGDNKRQIVKWIPETTVNKGKNKSITVKKLV